MQRPSLLPVINCHWLSPNLIIFVSRDKYQPDELPLRTPIEILQRDIRTISTTSHFSGIVKGGVAGMLLGHSASDEDPLKRPMLPMGNKLRRALWKIVWLLFGRFTPSQLHVWRCFLLRSFGAKMGASNFVYPDCKIWAPWLLKTGDVVTLGPGVEVYNVGGISIGDRSIISQDAFLCGATHDFNSPNFTLLPREISIGKNVWICAKAIVLPGIRCDDGSVLGAGSVASKSLEAWKVYAGNPARLVAERDHTAEYQTHN